MEPILQVSHLSVSLPGKNGPAPILKDISFSLKQGEILGWSENPEAGNP